jgi:hypothetical protein
MTRLLSLVHGEVPPGLIEQYRRMRTRCRRDCHFGQRQVHRQDIAAGQHEVGALLLEQNDEWATQRARYMTLETIATPSDDPLVSLPLVAV